MPMTTRYVRAMVTCRPFYLAFAIAALPTAPVSAQQGNLDGYIRTFLERRKIPAVSIAVVKDGKVVMSSAYGIANIELGTAATPQTVFEIGSISKQFAAVATLLLAQQGKLGLNDPIGKYLPDAPAAWAGITVHHLATHTAGLPDWESRTAFSYRSDYSAADFIKLVTPLPLDFEPGARFAYTNTGAPLLGIIIEKVSGIPYEQFVEENLFKPAGLGYTRFKHWGDLVSNRSGGYVEEEGQFRNGEPHRPKIIAPSGGIMSTAPDMAQWMGALGDGKILNRAFLEYTMSPVRLNNGTTFSASYGWFVDAMHGHRVLIHNGSTVGGFSSVVYYYPDDRLGVAVLMNVDRFDAVNVLAQRVAGQLIPALSAATIAEKADPDTALQRQFLGMLDNIANDRDSELLAPSLRNPGGPVRTNRARGFSGKVDKFAFLEREDLGAAGTVRFGNTIRYIYRYKLYAGDRLIYYTFELTPAGKVARFLAEEE